jgi:DNA-binding transcriptional ArsR family regulator
MESLLAITRALSDENRVRALLVLGDQEVCVCQLIELLQLAPSTVSKHMSVLRYAQLVVGRKKGRWMHYRLPGKTAAPVVRQVLSWVRQAVSEDPRIRMDAGRMKKILETSRSLICKRQSARRKQKGAEDEVAGSPGPFNRRPARKTASHKPAPLTQKENSQ